MSTRILFIDDDRMASEQLCATLRDRGFVVDYAAVVQSALVRLREARYDLVLVDLMMPSGGLGFVETRGGFQTGIALARRLRETRPELKILGITQHETHEAIEWFNTHACGLFSKADALRYPMMFVRHVERVLAAGGATSPRAFIVHGHDLALRDELKTVLEADFGLTVIVLDHLAWHGRTLIEKFEDEAMDVDLVFVLLTPDDIAIDDRESTEPRTRQNVLVELGYFLGRFPRHRGRVVLLVKGGVAMPSDLEGLGAIDVSTGIAAAHDAIRRELATAAHRRRP